MIYRNNSIAEENIDPNGRPAENKFEEWSEEVSERTDPGCKGKKVKSAKERKKLIREMDEVIKEDLKSSNPQPIGFRGNLLLKRPKFFYCTYSLGITETS